MMHRPDFAREVRRALSDPAKLCDALGLLKGAKRQTTGLLVCCPVHEERTPSCSVTRGPDGTVRVRCFGCDFGGDALALLAAVYGLSTRGEGFLQVLAKGASVAGLEALADEILGNRPVAELRPQISTPPSLPPAEYPSAQELRSLPLGSVDSDPECSGYLAFRRLDPVVCAERRLCRSLGPGELPRWASFRGESWRVTGHRLLVPCYDFRGRLRSVRACRVRPGDTPKRLPPAGKRAAELVLANRPAIELLRAGGQPQRILFAEGEPDFLTLATTTDGPVFGVLSGSWGERFAARIPNGSEVIVITHADQAGDRYAEQVASSLAHKCEVWRKKP